MFEYFTNMVITQVWPLGGAISGGSEVTVTGTDFADSALLPLWCQFGSVSVAAELLSSTQARCRAPPSPVSGRVAFHLHRGERLTTEILDQDASQFVYYPDFGFVLESGLLSPLVGGHKLSISSTLHDVMLG